MKISLVTTGLQVGGAETMVCEIAAGMRGRGHDVEVVSLIEPQAYVNRLAAAGVSVVSLGLGRRQKDPVSILKVAAAFRAHVQRHAPDVVHANMVHANLFARVALAGTGKPLVCTIHNTFEGGWVRDLGYRLTNWGSRLNTTISKAATDRLVAARILPDTTLTVYNGVNSAKFRGAPTREHPDPFRWIAVGRLERQKDYPTLLRAFAKTTHSELRIVGDGSKREELHRLARELGVVDRVRFLGTRDDVPQLLQESDGYVLSSSWEGFGIALVEAMLSELPIVATNSGGPPEIVGEAPACGYLVPPNDPGALARAMIDVAQRPPAERHSMGQAGARRAREMFELMHILDRWESIYLGLAGMPLAGVATA